MSITAEQLVQSKEELVEEQSDEEEEVVDQDIIKSEQSSGKQTQPQNVIQLLQELNTNLQSASKTDIMNWL